MQRRTNGAGTLILKPNGTYMAKWTYKGKRYFKTTGETDKRKALKKLDEFTRVFLEDNEIDTLMMMEAKVKATVMKFNIERAKENDVLLSELPDKYLTFIEVRDYAELTKEVCSRELMIFARWVNEHYPTINTVTKVTERVAEEYLRWAYEHYAKITYNHILTTLKRTWSILSHNGEWFKNVFKNYKANQQYNHSNRRELTFEEIVRLVEAGRNEEERLLVCFGIYTGMRIGDCCTVKWSQVDIEQKFITFVPNKTKRFNPFPIKIPINPVLHRGLLKALTVRDLDKPYGEYVMPDMARRYLIGTIRKVTDKLFKKANIPVIEKDEKTGKRKIVTGFHSLRRTFVSLNINSGMNPFLVQKIVGHSDAAMTQYYYEYNQDLMRVGLNKLPDFTRPKLNAPVIINNTHDVRSKEWEELDAFIDTLFDENGNPIRDKDKKTLTE